jgi:flagellar basal body-associated protein FliL
MVKSNNTKNNTKSNKIMILMIIIIIIIVIIFLFYLYFVQHRHNLESFKSFQQDMQMGTGMVNSTGTIYFDTSFQNIPLVFTQSLSSNMSQTSIINVFNISTQSFQFNKNVISNTKVDDFSSLTMDADNSNNFLWFAIDMSIISTGGAKCEGLCS